MNRYDAVRYPTYAKPETHPGRMAAMAALFGVEAAPPERCRVLELGCGTGGNLIPMAYGLPESRFTGVDAAEGPIADGCRRVRDLKLENISLRVMDLMEVGPDFGEFDYVIAHGVYSWVPAPVRDKILAICRTNLAPRGVAYVSYNAYPGCHLRQAVRDLLLYHTAGLVDGEARIIQARELASLVAAAQPETQLGRECATLLEREDGALFHDDLAEINEPVYFQEFTAHAGRHGLQYLSEAVYTSMQDAGLPPRIRELLEPLRADPLRREQYLDFAKLRRFRQTLLCREELALDREVKPERLWTLFASSQAQVVPLADGVVEFKGEKGASAKTAHPLAKAALAYLCRCFPRRAGFLAVLAEARAAAGSAAPETEDAKALGEILLHAFAAGLVQLDAYVAPLAPVPGKRPVASPLACLELSERDTVTTLTHALVKLDNDLGRRLVLLLDGTRDLAALAAELGAPPEAVDASLHGLARLALLTA
jgi:SAM-dependent methyltransferase